MAISNVCAPETAVLKGASLSNREHCNLPDLMPFWSKGRESVLQHKLMRASCLGDTCASIRIELRPELRYYHSREGSDNQCCLIGI
jgi:hypothetical protein